jgi:hypothetical protein
MASIGTLGVSSCLSGRHGGDDNVIGVIIALSSVVIVAGAG